MKNCLHHLITRISDAQSEATAVIFKKQVYSYAEINQHSHSSAIAFQHLGLSSGNRLAVYLPKQAEVVFSLFAASMLESIFVPVNPLLKAEQVLHILKDSGTTLLITSYARYENLRKILPKDIKLTVILVDKMEAGNNSAVYLWDDICQAENKNIALHDFNPEKTAAILYTSGSTGQPKGVELSHTNLMLGAQSVNQYLNITDSDRILALLPFSFDYGLNQLISSFLAGASCVLMDYLLPGDVLNTMARQKITGLAGVPSLWIKLAQKDWPEEVCTQLRYITNSGGVMPEHITQHLHKTCPNTLIYLMYGLTEAFRSSFLEPELVKTHANSIGKAIPHATLRVVDNDMNECGVDEVGELIHAGPLVAKGYWNNPQATQQKFKQHPQLGRVVLSGDRVKRDKQGLLYFVGRQDDMIKTTGYRVSPTEVEDILYRIDNIKEAVVFSLKNPDKEETIVAAVTSDIDINEGDIIHTCKAQLPGYMVPESIFKVDSLPKNPNGKINRLQLKLAFQSHFSQN